jgi:hypothetical protein
MVNPPRYGVFKFMAHEIEDNDNGDDDKVYEDEPRYRK